MGFKVVVVGRFEVRKPCVQIEFGQKGLGIRGERIGVNGPLRQVSMADCPWPSRFASRARRRKPWQGNTRA